MNELDEKLLVIISEEFSGVAGDHGLDHTLNVYHNALRLAKAEGADEVIVGAAALLHDIGRREEHEAKGKISHAMIGAEKARKILADLGSELEFIERVCLCVLRHSHRHGDDDPQSLEEKVVYDADKLDAIGAVGIGRAFMWAGKVGARLHNPNSVFSSDDEYGPEDTAYREYELKLKHVKDRMLTAEGKRLAMRRHQFMAEFFDEINQETNININR